MYDKKEIVQIRKIIVQRQIRELHEKIKALEEVLDRLDTGELSEEVFL